MRTQEDFWARYDEARAAADLFAVPPAALIAVIGPLEVAAPVAHRCRQQHWAGNGEVHVLTGAGDVEGEPDWKPVALPGDLVNIVNSDRVETPILVLDVANDPPPWLGDVVADLREAGVGLVHYVLDGDPTDEDLATWHGELGRPSVLDLASPVQPERVLALLERGEPVASIAGVPFSAELLMALQVEVAGDWAG